MKDGAFYRWVVWVSQGFAGEDSDYEIRHKGEEDKE